MDERRKLLPGAQWDDEHLGRRDDGGQGEHLRGVSGDAAVWGGNAYPALNVLFATPKGVLEEGVENPTKPKRGLDDVGRVFANYVIRQRADRDWKTSRNRPDCLNVLRWIVTRSGVSVICLPSASIVADLRDVSAISAEKRRRRVLTRLRALPSISPGQSQPSPRRSAAPPPHPARASSRASSY